MDASVFVRKANSPEYTALGSKKFSVFPRVDEFISADFEGGKKYFQVIAVHHLTADKGAVEIYAVQAEPSWEVKKGRAIGFGS